MLSGGGEVVAPPPSGTLAVGCRLVVGFTVLGWVGLDRVKVNTVCVKLLNLSFCVTYSQPPPWIAGL